MIEVKYIDRLGNNLFQYCFGRIVAEKLGYKLKAVPIPGFPNTGTEVRGHDFSSLPQKTLLGDEPQKTRRQQVDLRTILSDKQNRNILIEGYFQRYEYYKEYKEIIRNDWLLMDAPAEKDVDPDDVFVYIRRGDFVRLGYALPFSYYEGALQAVGKCKDIYIGTDNIKDPFLALFKKYKPIICHTTHDPLKDFVFMMSFNKIIQSASSFSWWASFLSKAEAIYTPAPFFGHWSGEYPGVDLTVDDEARYVYLSCQERYKKSIYEKCIEIKNRSILENIKILGNKVRHWIR